MTLFMQTHMGHAFYPTQPDPSLIEIEDIAHALSMTCRYGGHTEVFYSVAEHSVLMSRAVSPQNALSALLHDATEAYMGDLIYPLKPEIPRFEEVETNLFTVIAAKFGIPSFLPKEVKEADLRIVVDERGQLMKMAPAPWVIDTMGLHPLGVPCEGWSPYRAKNEFLLRYTQLTEKENN